MFVFSLGLSVALGANVMPMGNDEPCGMTSFGGEQTCPLYCPQGYTMKCMWTGCDWRTCADFGPAVLRNDRACKNAGYDYTEKMCCTCQECSNVNLVYIMQDGVELVMDTMGKEVVMLDVPSKGVESQWELAYNSEFRQFLIKSRQWGYKVLENVDGKLELVAPTGEFEQQFTMTLIDGKYLISNDFMRLRVKNGNPELIPSSGPIKDNELFQVIGADGVPLCVSKEGPLGEAMRWSKPDYQVHPTRPADECLLFDYKFMRNATLNYPRKLIDAETAEECWAKCQNDKVKDADTGGVCKGWSWKEGADEPCRLFSNTKSAMNKTEVISGKRACHPQYGKIAGTGVIPGWKTKGKDGPKIALADFEHVTSS